MTSARLCAKRALGAAGVLVRPFRTIPRRWVLCLHDVGGHPWSYDEGRFADLVARLAAETDLVPLGTLLSSSDGARLRVAVTFDDGYVGVADRVLPLLRRHRAVPTVFVPALLVADEDGVPTGEHGLYAGVPLLGWRRLSALMRAGEIDVGSHGARHVPLPRLSPADRRHDLAIAREEIRRRTGGVPAALAYPFGAFDAATVADARAVGYSHALTTIHGGVREGFDPYRVPRVDVRAEYEVRDVLAILRGDWDLLGALQRRRAAAAPTCRHARAIRRDRTAAHESRRQAPSSP